MPKIVFSNERRTVQTHLGATLLQAAKDSGISLHCACGGNCACTTCRVIVVAGGHLLSQSNETEHDLLDAVLAHDRHPKLRLSCQAVIERDGTVVVEIPD